MGFPESHAAVEEERVVFAAGFFGYGLAGRVRQAVIGPHDEILQRVVGVQDLAHDALGHTHLALSRNLALFYLRKPLEDIGGFVAVILESHVHGVDDLGDCGIERPCGIERHVTVVFHVPVQCHWKWQPDDELPLFFPEDRRVAEPCDELASCDLGSKQIKNLQPQICEPAFRHVRDRRRDGDRGRNGSGDGVHWKFTIYD